MPPSKPLHARSSPLALKVPPLALVGLFALAMVFAPALASGHWRGAARRGAGWAACALAVIGAAVCIAGVLEFRRASTTVNPTAPTLSSALVVRGIYRFTRNPMYLGFAVLLLALAVWMGKLSALLLVPVFMAYLQRFQIRPEEQALGARFGPSFEAYCKRVRRWL